MRIIDVTRGLYTFAVMDDDQTRSWNFWEQQYASGVWEPQVLEAIHRHLADGGTYLDIGAWVGPTVLWGAQRADHVIAIEPDPYAVPVLLSNVAMNAENVSIWPAAVTNGIVGSIILRNRADWGNSGSTTIAPELYLRHSEGEAPIIQEVTAPAVDIGDVLARAGQDLALVKIDIEGGEADLLGRLTEVRCPMIISMHWPWIADSDGAMADLRALGELTLLEDSDGRFPAYLVRP